MDEKKVREIESEISALYALINASQYSGSYTPANTDALEKDFDELRDAVKALQANMKSVPQTAAKSVTDKIYKSTQPMFERVIEEILNAEKKASEELRTHAAGAETTAQELRNAVGHIKALVGAGSEASVALIRAELAKEF